MPPMWKLIVGKVALHGEEGNAVAGDAPGWECFPPKSDAKFLYHEVLLAGWGCPIEELFWLEDLTEACKEERRWTFFLASSTLNIDGGVASPANIMAIL